MFKRSTSQLSAASLAIIFGLNSIPALGSTNDDHGKSAPVKIEALEAKRKSRKTPAAEPADQTVAKPGSYLEIPHYVLETQDWKYLEKILANGSSQDVSTLASFFRTEISKRETPAKLPAQIVTSFLLNEADLEARIQFMLSPSGARAFATEPSVREKIESALHPSIFGARLKKQIEKMPLEKRVLFINTYSKYFEGPVGFLTAGKKSHELIGLEKLSQMEHVKFALYYREWSGFTSAYLSHFKSPEEADQILRYFVSALQKSDQSLEIPSTEIFRMASIIYSMKRSLLTPFLVTADAARIYNTLEKFKEETDKLANAQELRAALETMTPEKKQYFEKVYASVLHKDNKPAVVAAPTAESKPAVESKPSVESKPPLEFPPGMSSKKKIALIVEHQDWVALQKVFGYGDGPVLVDLISRKSPEIVPLPVEFVLSKLVSDIYSENHVKFLLSKTGETLYSTNESVAKFYKQKFKDMTFYAGELDQALNKLSPEEGAHFRQLFAPLLEYKVSSRSSYFSDTKSEIEKAVKNNDWVKVKDLMSSSFDAGYVVSAVDKHPDVQMPEEFLLRFVKKADLSDNTKFLLTSVGRNAWSQNLTFQNAFKEKLSQSTTPNGFSTVIEDALKKDMASIPSGVLQIWVTKISEEKDYKSEDPNGQSRLESFAKNILPKPPLNQDPALAMGVAFYAKAGNKVLRRVNRYLLSQDHTKDPKDKDALRWEMVRHVVEISDQKARQEEIRSLVALHAAGKFDEVKAFMQNNTKVALPDGYEMVKPVLGVGKNGSVALVKRVSDGALFAWKKPSNDHEDNKRALVKEVELAKKWRDLGVSKMDAILSADGTSLFKTFVPGPTLKKLMVENDIFNHPESIEYQALQRMLTRAVMGKTYISGVNSENLIFDGEEFQIIDSAHVDSLDSRRETFNEYRTTLIGKWSRGDLGDFKERITRFFDRLQPVITDRIEIEKQSLRDLHSSTSSSGEAPVRCYRLFRNKKASESRITYL